MDKNELVNLILNDDEIKNAIFKAVVNNKNFNREVGIAVEQNDDDRRNAEARAWV